MTIDLKKELSSNQTILLVIPSIEYNEVIINVIKNLSENVCYVTANKTFDSLKELFKKNKVNIKNIVFVDAISKSLKKVPDSDNQVYYVSSPGALTELSLVIEKFLRYKFDYLIFDSITNLTIYNKMPVCAKFMTSLINKIKKTKTKAAFYALNIKEQEGMINQAGMFVDKVIDTENKSP